MRKNINPLVSVLIVTYNSSETIQEALDSVYSQTYKNIELVISDDCSNDETVSICKKWIDEHSERFVRCELITTPQNTGLSSNYNRAAAKCQGEWVKDLDGDDVLLPNCVERYVDFIIEHKDARIVFARSKTFGTSEEIVKVIDRQFNYDFFKLSREQQLNKLLLEKNCISSATVFYSIKVIERMGKLNDERIPLLDDWPKWINLLKAGVHFSFLDKVTVLYRASGNSLSTGKSYSPAFAKSMALFYKYYQFDYEYKHGNKKQAIENWLRSQYTITQSKMWYVPFKLYKILIMRKLH